MEHSSSDDRGGRRRRPVVIADKAGREQRRQQRRAEARQRERRIDAAERDFYAAVDAIARIEAERDEQLADLEARARRIRVEAENRLDEQGQQQTRAIGQLREQGCAAEQIAATLDLPLTRVRVILNENRRLRNQAAAQAATSGPPAAPDSVDQNHTGAAGSDPAVANR